MGGKAKSISERIVHSVAARDDSDPLELPPLYYAIDPDALEAGLEVVAGGSIQFEFAGYDVTVSSDETITVSEVRTGTATSGKHAG